MKRWLILAFLAPAIFLVAEVNVLSRSNESIFVQLTVDNYQFTESSEFTFINMEDWSYNAEVGGPSVPILILNVAVPPDGDISYRILNRTDEAIDLDKPVSPVPEIRQGKKTSDEYLIINSEKYREFTQNFVEVQEKSFYRKFEYVPLVFSPFLFDPATNRMRICTEINLEISIGGDLNYSRSLNDGWENIYHKMFLNYESARNWRSTKQISHTRMPFEASEFWYRIETESDGLYKIGSEQLAQLPSFCDPISLQLFTMYREGAVDKYKIARIPLKIVDDDHVIDAGDAAYFVRTDLEDAAFPDYTETQTFWLTFGASIDSAQKIETDFSNLPNAREIGKMERKIYQPEAISRDNVDAAIIYPKTGVFDSQSEQFAGLHPQYNFVYKSQAEIFDEYSGGDADPHAVKAYLDTLYDIHPELTYCILMGSGSMNWDNTTAKNKIMAFPMPTGAYSSDDNFCLLDGSRYPSLIMGRLPAKNDSEMNFLLDRIATYINSPTPGLWRDKILIIPDDDNKSGGYEGTSTGMNHSAIAQSTGDTLKSLHPEIYIDKVMTIEYPFDAFQNKPAAREAMIESINAGRLVWYYIGHGDADTLGDEEYFRGSEHLNLLDNLEHLPLFIAASCHVGQFDQRTYDCLCEKLLFCENGGSIASIGATSGSSGLYNTALFRQVLINIVNELPRLTIGNALLSAKLSSANIGFYSNSRQYNILGDPMMVIAAPQPSYSITGVSEEIQARELVQIEGDFNHQLTGTGELSVFEPEHDFLYMNNNFIVSNDTIPYTVQYTKEGNRIFHGNNEINLGTFSAEFYVPDDVNSGTSGYIYNYLFDELTQQDYASVFAPLSCSDLPVSAASTTPPAVQLYIDSRNFAEGDYVSTDPTVIAEIEDENGINITGAAGHKILLLLDDSLEPIDATEGFTYNSGSATAGELTWTLQGLDEGAHHLTLVVFDNLNNPTVAETNFKAKKSGKVAIEQMFPYPNPMKKDGYFTFVITEASDVTISIYTVTGKKIRTLKSPGLSAGYHQVYWNGKDGDGDKIANNTYLYKIRAKQLSNKKITEKIGKVVILK